MFVSLFVDFSEHPNVRYFSVPKRIKVVEEFQKYPMIQYALTNDDGIQVYP